MEGKSMKRLISLFVQFVLMLGAFFAGSIAPVFRVLPLWRVSIGSGRWFVLDGLFVLLIVYVLLLLIALLRRRLIHSGLTSTAAFVLALLVGLLSKFPFTSN
jgi:hypothetical protein